MSLGGLEEFNRSSTPSDYEILLFIFFERGITLDQFNELPVPYILAMARVYSWQKDQELKAMKKGRKGK